MLSNTKRQKEKKTNTDYADYKEIIRCNLKKIIYKNWIPAFAGMTGVVAYDLFCWAIGLVALPSVVAFMQISGGAFLSSFKNVSKG